MTEKAILSAIIFILIYLALVAVIIGLCVRVYEEYSSDGSKTFLTGVYVLLLVVFTVIMLIYTNWWITIIPGIIIVIIIGILTDINDKVTCCSIFIIIWCIICFIVGLLFHNMIEANQAEQHIETEITNIVYGENIKVEDLSQDTIYIEKIVLQEHYNLITPLGAENYYKRLEDEDSYKYYYKIEEENGKTKSMAEIIPSNDVKIQYVKDRKKAMMKKIVTETYYEKPFFGIEVPMLKKDIETKYEFYIPIELLEVVEIK